MERGRFTGDFKLKAVRLSGIEAIMGKAERDSKQSRDPLRE
jgi:hypothetical protein